MSRHPVHKHPRSVVGAHIPFRDHGDDDSPLTQSVWAYDTNDPYALTIRFGTTAPRYWTFSRDLVNDALAGEPSGEGDVRTACYAGTFLMHLTSPDGEGVLAFDANTVGAYMNRVLTACPAGSEVCDVDAELATILGGAHE